MSIHQAKAILSNPKSLALLDQAVASGCNFAAGVLLARWLGLAGFGQYSLLWMGVLFLLSLHQAYITQPMQVLAFGKTAGERPAYLAALSALQVLASVAIAALSLVVFFSLKMLGCKADLLPGLPLAGLAAAAYLFHDFLRKAAFLNDRPALPLLMDGTAATTLLTALWLLHLAGHLGTGTALAAAALAYALGCAIGAWPLNLLTSKTGGGLKPPHDPASHRRASPINWLATMKEHYHCSYWLLATSLVQWFSGNYFLVAAAGTLGAAALGALRMAQNLVGLCHVLFLAMENTVPAEAARQLFTEGKPAMHRYLRRVTLLGAVPLLALLGGLTLAATWLIGWLYGSDYQGLYHLVTAYSVLYVFVYVGYPLRFALRAMRRTSPIFVAYVATAVASLSVASAVVARWGLVGVMGGLIGSQLLMLAVYAVALSQGQADKKNPSPNTPLTRSPAHPINPLKT